MILEYWTFRFLQNNTVVWTIRRIFLVSGKLTKTSKIPSIRLFERNTERIDLGRIAKIHNSVVVVLCGFYQRQEYLKPYKKEVIDLFDLTIDETILKKI